MKRFLALTLVLVMVLALCACGGGSSKDAVGTWTLKSLSNGTQSFTVDEVPEMKDYIVIVLKEGGTGTITSGGEVNNLTWDATTITVQGDAATYSISGDTMTINGGGYTFVLTRR